MERYLLLGIASCIATRAIRKQNDFADIKPAIQALEHFLSEGLIGAAEIVQLKMPEELGFFRMKSVEKDSQNPDNQQEQVNQSVQSFAFSVLEWTQYPNCAPAVGRFLPMFFKSLEESRSDNGCHTSKDSMVPLWIAPVKQSLERRKELLEIFEIHILPGLLRLGPTDVEAFLKTLPLENIQCGSVGSSSIFDIHFCLSVAKIAEDSSIRKHLGQEQSGSLDLETLGICLLDHSSSSVRIGALSLLVSSASARPFCRRVLRRMRQCIPYFHVEVNPKPRNEIIAIMKKLCMRLRSATKSLLRCGQDPDTLTRDQTSIPAQLGARSDGNNRTSSENVFEQELDETSHVLDEHLAFRKWYMVFLIQELRPTASYQSHITALKMLEMLTEQTVGLANTPSKSRNDYLGTLNGDLPSGLLLRPLTDLLLDPFDDVRQSANIVFDLHLSTNSFPRISTSKGKLDKEADLVSGWAKKQADNEEDLRNANRSILLDLNKAENISGITGRADHADGFGRLNNLLYATSTAVARPTRWHQDCHLIVDRVVSTLEKDVDIAKNDLLFAVSSRPLHGHLIALR